MRARRQSSIRASGRRRRSGAGGCRARAADRAPLRGGSGLRAGPSDGVPSPSPAPERPPRGRAGERFGRPDRGLDPAGLPPRDSGGLAGRTFRRAAGRCGGFAGEVERGWRIGAEEAAEPGHAGGSRRMPGFGFGGPAVRVRGLDFAGPFRLRRSSVGIAKGATAARYLITNSWPARMKASASLRQSDARRGHWPEPGYRAGRGGGSGGDPFQLRRCRPVVPFGERPGFRNPGQEVGDPLQRVREARTGFAEPGAELPRAPGAVLPACGTVGRGGGPGRSSGRWAAGWRSVSVRAL